MSYFEEGTFFSKDNTKLHFGIKRVNDDPSRWFFMVHGFAEYLDRYEHFAKFINELGFNFFMFEFRGHGSSEGARGFIRSYQDYLDDLDSAIQFLKSKEQVSNFHIMAHSQGGLILANFFLKNPVTPISAIFSAPAFAFAVSVPLWKKVMANVASFALPALSMPSGLKGEDVSRDKKVQEEYDKDPKIFKIARARWFTESIKAQENLEKLKEYKVNFPVLLLQGTADKLVSAEKNFEFFKKIVAPRKELKKYKGLYHELINEPEKDVILNDIKEWLLSFKS